MRRRICGAVATLGASTFLAVADPALATHVPGHPGNNAAVSQYVEQVPTSGGTQATGFGKATNKPLAPNLKRDLYQQAGNDAPLLEEISTSSQYGAPQKTLRNKKKGGGGKVVTIPRETEDTSATKALSAVRTVVTDGSEGRLIALLVVLLAITGFAVAAAGYRQRALRRPLGR